MVDWDLQEKLNDPLYKGVPREIAQQAHAIKKQILLTKIQMKHALKVGGKVREGLGVAESQTQVLLDDTAQAVGIMQSIKIGNQLTGMVSKSLQTLNIQMNEYTQAYAAAELEKNNVRGLVANRTREALDGFGDEARKEKPLPLNPIGKF